MTTIKFGTDGWRALMATDYTMDNVARVAQSFADYLKATVKDAPPRVVVGYDFREHSEDFAAEFARILAGNGMDVVLSDRAVPTPAVSRAVIEDKRNAGVAITASHNPGTYNGVKIKDAQGASAGVDVTGRIEEGVDKSPVKKNGKLDLKAASRDILTPYLDRLRAYVRMDLFNKKPFRILVDSMHGVGARHIEKILAGTAVAVTTLRGERDVRFGGVNPEPIPANMPETIKKMKEGGYDLAVVTDGDADRIGAVRPGGEFVSPGTLLSLIMLHMARDLGQKGSVVTTVSNTSLIYRVARGLGLKIHETPVGFKHIVAIMRRENVLIAGEESGGLAFQNYMLERDGILSALLLIQMMAYRGRSFEEILKETEKEFGRFHYLRRDLAYADELKPKLIAKLRALDVHAIAQSRVTGKKTEDGVKLLFENDAWLLFRLSGTEPLLRVYAESTDAEEAARLSAWGEEIAHSVK